MSAPNAKVLTGTKDEQGDEEILETLSSWITDNFRVTVGTPNTPLKELFPEPEKQHLKKFVENNSHADLPILRHDKLVCIVEPGGFAHFSDKKQRIRDKKKDAICRINNVNCLRISNDVVNHLHKTETKRLFRKYIYGMVR